MKSADRLAALAIRMYPSTTFLKPEGAATVICHGNPGLPINIFAHRGTNIGALHKINPRHLVMVEDGYTNSVGFNPTSQGLSEAVSPREIIAAWQPQIPANIALWLLHRETKHRQGRGNFPHNEVMISPKDALGLVVTDVSQVSSQQFKDFSKIFANRFDTDQVYHYEPGKLSVVCPTSNKLEAVSELKDVISLNYLNNFDGLLEQEYKDHIKGKALSYYDPADCGFAQKEFEALKTYIGYNKALEMYYDDWREEIDKLHEESPSKFPRVTGADKMFGWELYK